uniref:Sushi domain-containing protein n=1 Tax=Strigamia maritima TaxID=126957 RepID=T1IHA3_STRMM
MLLQDPFSSLYFFTILVLTISDKAHEESVKIILATEGEDLHLKCEVDASKLNEDLVWKTETIVISSGSAMSLKSNRFKPDVDSNTLIIYNATQRDNRQFSCSDTLKTYSVFNVTVKELICKDADDLANGLIEYSSLRDLNGEHKHGTKLTYHCKDGYVLIGVDTRYCDSPTTKWSGEKATCKDLHVIRLERKIESFDIEIQKLLYEVNNTNSEKTKLAEELMHQYSLWEYLFYEFSSYKTVTEDTTNKLEQEIEHLYSKVNRPVARLPLCRPGHYGPGYRRREHGHYRYK